MTYSGAPAGGRGAMGVLAVKVCSSLRPAALQIAHRAAHTPSNQLRRTRPRSAMSASHRNLPVRKQRSLSDGAEKNGRRPRSMSERLRNHYYAMFDTRPRRAFQAAASRLHRLLGVDGKPVSRSKRPVRGPSDDPEGPAAVLGVSMSSPTLALPRSSPRVYGWPFWTYGSSMVCGGCRGAEVRDLWIPSSFRPQSAQEPFPCFRASPGCYKFDDDVPPD
jgi:hypothetical protein